MFTLLLALACADKAPTESSPDDSASDDSASDDSASDDSASDTADDHSGDSGDSEDTALPFEPLDGFGTLSGDCGVLDDEWSVEAPFLFMNTLDFGSEVLDEGELSAGGQEVYDDGNLGGSSLYSEVFAYEVLYRCELAELLKTEAEILYTNTGGKKTDLLLRIDGLKVGVSVTRAYAWPPEDPYTVAQAAELLADKLGDIPLSAANAAAEDAWDRSILSVIAYTPDHAAAIAEAWAGLDPSLTLDTLVVVTATEGEDELLY